MSTSQVTPAEADPGAPENPASTAASQALLAHVQRELHAAYQRGYADGLAARAAQASQPVPGGFEAADTPSASRGPRPPVPASIAPEKATQPSTSQAEHQRPSAKRSARHKPSFVPGRHHVLVPTEADPWRTFHLSGAPGGRPDQPTAIRIEANRPLKNAEIHRINHLIAYAYRTTVCGAGTGKPSRDSTRSFVIDFDTAASERTDPRAALAEFEAALRDSLVEGSPIRKTDRAGSGTKGTRAVDGLGDSGLRISVYYDKVTKEF